MTSSLRTRFEFDYIDKIVLGATLLFFYAWATILTIKYQYFGFYDWDLALYAQALHELSRGRLTSSLFDMSFLANHAEYIMVLLAPLYRLISHPLLLIYLKVFSFVGGALVFYMIARNLIPRWSAAVLFFIFHLFPANIFATLYEFHLESLNVLPLFLIYYFFQKNNLKGFWLCLLGLVIIKENMPPLIGAFGIYAFFCKNKPKIPWSIGPIIFACVYFYLTMFIFGPQFRENIGGGNQYIGFYGDLGRTPIEIARNLLLNPKKVLSIIYQPLNMVYLGEFLRPFAFLPAFHLQTIFLAAPILLQHTLSSAVMQKTIYYHYATTVTPFIFLACTQALHLLFTNTKQRVFILAFVAILATQYMNFMVHSPELKERLSAIIDTQDLSRQRALREIPPQVGVISTLNFLAHLTEHQNLYALLHVSRDGLGLSNRPFKLPAEVSYVLADFTEFWMVNEIKDTPQISQPRLEKFFSLGWSVHWAENDIVIFKKASIEESSLVQRINPTSLPSLTHVGKIELLNLDPPLNQWFTSEKKVPLKLHWRSTSDHNPLYYLIFQFSKEGKIYHSQPHLIGYTILPTNTLKAGDEFTEQFWLSVPHLAPGEYSLAIKFSEHEPDSFVNFTLSGKGQRIKELPLGTIRIR